MIAPLLALLVQLAPTPAWCWAPSRPAFLRLVTWEAGDGARCVGRPYAGPFRGIRAGWGDM